MAAVVTVAAALECGLVFVGPSRLGGPTGLFLFAVAAAVGAATLGSPMLALVLLLFASFFRQGITIPGMPADAMVMLLGALVLAVTIAWCRGRFRIRFGRLEAVMAAYVAWNAISALSPHEYPATDAHDTPYVVYRFILSGTILPFLASIIGRALIRDGNRVRAVYYPILVVTAYSAAVSIMQFTGPTALVWPRYIVTAPAWIDRANGIFNQPVMNGLVMVTGFVTAVLVMHERTLGPTPRILAASVAVAAVPAIYLTRTRVVWLAWVLSLIICAVWARRRRTGFVVTLLLMALFVGATWATFISSDRRAGGVGSTHEVEDRANTLATSIWAIEQKPLVGWGIGRFTQVNTQHHKKWDESIDFQRGYAISSHENELGIWAELGLVGLTLWLFVLALFAHRLHRALRRLAPRQGLAGRSLGLLALTAAVSWVVCGFTVDLRFFDFVNLLVFLLAGAAVGCAEEPQPTSGAGSPSSTGRRSPLEAGAGGALLPAPAVGGR